MKSLQILILVLGFTIFSLQNVQAQASTQEIEKTVYKINKTKTPQKVKECLNKYSAYKISNEVTYTDNNKGKVYKFKMQKGNWSHLLLIDESGKVLGIETGEH